MPRELPAGKARDRKSERKKLVQTWSGNAKYYRITTGYNINLFQNLKQRDVTIKIYTDGESKFSRLQMKRGFTQVFFSVLIG